MENIMIIVVLVLIAVAAVSTLVKRSGRKGCCSSGSDYKPRKKKLKKITATKVFQVDGMHCEKCSNRVTEIVNDIPGVAGVVDLKKGTVTVSYEQDVPDELIRQRMERVGYSVREIQ